MSLIITPGQLSQRADFYQQLGQLTSAGLGLVRALEQLQRSPPAASYRRPIGQLLAELQGGCTLADALQRVEHWLPALDVALLQAGEHSGRLEASFGLLTDYYNARARVARRMAGDLAYPLFLFHFAVFIFPFRKLFLSGNWLAYLAQTLGILLPIYVVGGLVIYAAQSGHGEAWRARLEAILHRVPVLGTARLYLALSRLSAALEALLNAGVTVVEAWEMAAKASGSPALNRAVTAWRPRVDAGQTPAEAIREAPIFPELFANQYATGEVSGQLDDTLRRLRAYYEEEGSRKLHAVAQWTPRAVYLFVVLMIGYQVLHFYIGYFNQIGQAALEVDAPEMARIRKLRGRLAFLL
jgi:type IV pilus assembly protein PilC